MCVIPADLAQDVCPCEEWGRIEAPKFLRFPFTSISVSGARPTLERGLKCQSFFFIAFKKVTHRECFIVCWAGKDR